MTTFMCGRAPAAVRLLPRDNLVQYTSCCMGAAEDGAWACTCWEPVFTEEQRPADTSIVPETRTVECGDCAYRPDSPELSADPYALEMVDVFWCHKGLRRPREWRHPDGRVRAADRADYQPPIVDGVPYRADGRPAARCGGWAQRVAS